MPLVRNADQLNFDFDFDNEDSNKETASQSEVEVNHLIRENGRRFQRGVRIENHNWDNYKPKIDIGDFDERLHIEDYLEWEQSVDNFFDYMKIGPNKQVRFVACKITGGTATWWNQLLRTSHREGRSPMRN